MRKLFFAAAMLLLSQAGFGQAVKDNAVIPVSITLNSILRLTVTSGGNIQFVVNTIEQYTNGIANAPQYTTNFVVSSSRNFDVTLGAEDASFIGLETGGNMDLNFLRYTPQNGTNGTGATGTTTELTDLSAPVTIVSRAAGGQLDYSIEWELGTDVTNTLLAANLSADIYVTNVFLNLAPQ
ncbi:MAG: hypothetical protein PWR03_2352 [Tenuifilum sp.]|uniref:hypothetical protein n=1 Tax=Tenuifilum sp. TaxID=2760880 RepID=UPI0024AB6D31|nr:hypothetical protein [Tenuifilum sp.]MDI3528168.1 hypothetical protein [Tenuifilum sp.]